MAIAPASRLRPGMQMSSTPPSTVSVVIPCRDQAGYLKAAIDSVRAQTWQVVDLIVVDDGSTDGSAGVAAAAGVTVISHSHRGLSEARNAGLRAASGDFIVFLDADDELLHDAVETGVRTLEAHPHAAVAVGRCLAMDAQGRPVPVQHHAINPADLYGEWLSKNFVWTPGAAMFRRQKLAARGGFPARLGPAADYAVYLRLARTGEAVYHGRELVRYRRHSASMSRDPALMLRTTAEVLRRERKHAPRSMRAAIKRGRQAWQAWYGEQLSERLLRDVRAGRWGRRQIGAAITLIRHCPGLVSRRALRKLGRALAG